MGNKIMLPLFILLFFTLCLAICCLSKRSWGKESSLSALSSSTGKEASWNDQLLYMGYLLYRTSNINVIKGLNLSHEQLVSLKRLSKEMEHVVPPFTLKGKLSPDLAEVEKGYLKLMDALMSKDSVTPALLKDVARVRGIEARVIRDGLCSRNVGSFGDCRRCHRDAREGARSFTAWQKSAANPRVKKEQGYAHFKSFLGTRGLAELAKHSRQVDGILTANQRLMLDDFSCCLVPPQDLNSPVRIGQVEVSLGEVKMLEAVRSVPAAKWPAVRDSITGKIRYIEFLKTPDVSGTEVDSACARAVKAMEKARALKDEDFELQKEGLAAGMKERKEKKALPEKARLIKQAFFLLLPGSQGVYSRMLGY